MTVICEFCSNEFKNDTILSKHKKTAKYCIRIQSDNSESFKLNIYKCEWCNKEYFRIDHFKLHNVNCKINPEKNQERDDIIKEKDLIIKEKDNIIKEKDILIIDLEKKIAILETRLENKSEMSEKFESLHSKREDCIEKIALQPKNTTTKTTSNSTQNNILNNLPIFNLTKEKLQLIASTEFTHELFLRGQEGAAKFATNIARKENDGDLP